MRTYRSQQGPEPDNPAYARPRVVQVEVLRRSNLDHAQRFFERHVPKTVLLARFVPSFGRSARSSPVSAPCATDRSPPWRGGSGYPAGLRPRQTLPIVEGQHRRGGLGDHRSIGAADRDRTMATLCEPHRIAARSHAAALLMPSKHCADGSNNRVEPRGNTTTFITRQDPQRGSGRPTTVAAPRTTALQLAR